MRENAYKSLRKKLDLTRDEVCDTVAEENLGILSPERLERIENGKFPITPEEVLLLSKVYKQPALCNYYCSHECPIGAVYVPEVQVKDLEKTVLSMLASLNSMKQRQERLIEITFDGRIDDAELKDFISIQKELEKISLTVESLQLWTEQMIADGKIDIEKYNALKDSE